MSLRITYVSGSNVKLFNQELGAVSPGAAYIEIDSERIKEAYYGTGPDDDTVDWNAFKSLFKRGSVTAKFEGISFTNLSTLIAAIVADDPSSPLQTAKLAPVRFVRGVVFANVADLAAFTVAGNDGLTYTAGQRVLLPNQTTAAQCGIYEVGTVTAGSAALSRVADMPSGMAIQNGMIVEVSEGTIYAGSTWKAMCTGSKVVATDDSLFYPRVCKARVTLAVGVYALGATEGLFLFSTTKTQVHFNRVDAANSALTIQYAAPVATRTAGKSGTGALTVRAEVGAGTLNNADTSTMDVVAINW